MMIIRVGSRRSKLALVQTHTVVELLEAANPHVKCEIVEIETSGDKMLDVDLSKVGGKGLFLKEIEAALLEGRIDIAMHSLKDVPAQLPEGLELSAYLTRDNPFDCLVSARYASLQDMPSGARVGTSSLRRKHQLLALRPDLNVEFMRGNVDTRIAKVDSGEFDAAVMAAAGLERLGLSHRIAQLFSVDEMIPAVGQGIVCVEARSGSEAAAIVRGINNETSMFAAQVERKFMTKMGGSCTLPIGAYLQGVQGEYQLSLYYYNEARSYTHSRIQEVKDMLEIDMAIDAFL